MTELGLKLSLVGFSTCVTRLYCVLFVALTEFAIAVGRRTSRRNSGYAVSISSLYRNCGGVFGVFRKGVRQTLAHRENCDAL